MDNQSNKWKFIVIEGVDGVGKTTIAKLLCERLSAQYYKTPPLAFSQFYRIVNNNRKESLKEYLDSLSYSLPNARFLFYLLTLVKASEEITQLLKINHVVCDRYLSSTLAYHWALNHNLRNADIDWLSILKPDLEFLLLVQDEVEHQRRFVQGRDKPKHGLETNVILLKQVQGNFRELNLIEIDVTNLSAEDTLEHLLKKITNQFAKLA